ncbi:MAG: sulfur carrier protein ThiS [Deltaproteobacteria bacterium]|nr:MAG: sulfur carrier protein ThiS [Deltaproteobacteria bacterium]
MNVVVNGEARDLPAGTTVKALLAELGLDRDGIAVAVDRRVVPRSRHESTELAEGQSVEIIRAVGGG